MILLSSEWVWILKKDVANNRKKTWEEGTERERKEKERENKPD